MTDKGILADGRVARCTWRRRHGARLVGHAVTREERWSMAFLAAVVALGLMTVWALWP